MTRFFSVCVLYAFLKLFGDNCQGMLCLLLKAVKDESFCIQDWVCTVLAGLRAGLSWFHRQWSGGFGPLL